MRNLKPYKITNNTKLSDISLDYTIHDYDYIRTIDSNLKYKEKMKLKDMNFFSIGEIATGRKDCLFELTNQLRKKYNYCKIEKDDTFSTIEAKIILYYTRYKTKKYFNLDDGEIFTLGLEYLFIYLELLSCHNLVLLFNNFLNMRALDNMFNIYPNCYKAEEIMKKQKKWMNHEVPWKLTWLLFNFKRTGYMEFDSLETIEDQDKCDENFQFLTKDRFQSIL